jgi:hypothetical protein
VLGLLLAGVRVPVPEVAEEEWPTGDGESGTPLDALHRVCDGRHDVWVREAALSEYADSGLPTTTMGRELEDDRLFFAAALAAGDALGALVKGEGPR